MKFFSLPTDFKKETIDAYCKLNDQYKDARVIETYGNITIGNSIESGRSVDLLPAVDLNHLRDYVRWSREKNIDFSYTMNASHMHSKEFTRKGMLEILSFLNDIYEAGVRSLTVSLPSLMQVIQRMNTDFRMKASVICQVTTANKALFYKNMGMERVVVDESINRDFDMLKRIVEAFGENIEMIVNTICHKDCPYRMFHYNQIATDSIVLSSEVSAKYYSHRCLMRRYENAGNLLKLSWVRPEDLKYYTRVGIRYFKLQGRQAVLAGDPVKAVEYYFKGSYDGDLLELLDMFNPTSNFRVSIDNKALDGFIETFFKKAHFCRHDCRSCFYCDTFARKCIAVDEVAETRRNVLRFYDEYDHFNKLLASIKNEKKGQGKNFFKREQTEWDADFEM